MGRRNEWEMFFDGYAPNYMTEAFTKNTVKEIDFVLEELKLTPARALLAFAHFFHLPVPLTINIVHCHIYLPQRRLNFATLSRVARVMEQSRRRSPN